MSTPSQHLAGVATFSWLSILFLLAMGAAPLAQQNTELPTLPNRYRTVVNVVTMPEGRTMGSSNAVNVDSKGNIWLFERCGANSCAESKLDPILQFDPTGKFVKSFGGGMFVFPHAVIIDGDDNLWIIDAGVVDNVKGNQIFKFLPSGQLLLTLGKAGTRGTAPGFGAKGNGPGQFDCPHSIALDSTGRIFVGDRTNNRIQILSPRGEFIAEWRQFGRPSVRDGVVTGFIPDPAPHDGTSFPEGISVDRSGTIWGASVGDRDVRKFVPLQ